MALKSPIMPSPTGGLVSAFSPYNDSPASSSPHHNTAFIGVSQFKRTSANSESLAPPSPYPQHIEPSPVDSNGTEGTEIEDDAQDHEGSEVSTISSGANRRSRSPLSELSSPHDTNHDAIHKIDTSVAPIDASDGPQSVIHAPVDFKRFDDTPKEESAKLAEDTDVTSPTFNLGAVPGIRERKMSAISPVNTDVPRYIDRSTPQAQTRQDLEEEWKRKSRRTSSLEDIPEAHDKDAADSQEPEKDASDEDEGPDTAGLIAGTSMSRAMEESLHTTDQEIAALRTALAECWTLCNTLASLSSNRRLRSFKYTARQEVREQAWLTCWRLCQKLYESQDQGASALETIPTLEMCRDFCQSLFEARQRGDEASDSVLRVSFELNNHLYNTHDRTLPEAFNERTLDFYITLCHRLMKKPTALAAETDALLRACWSLAEMLFSLRQIQRDNKPADEELLGSAIQSCWDLCNLFREDCIPVRPDRGTPRPSQTSFSGVASYKDSSVRSDGRSSSSLSNRPYHDALGPPPETPTTIFDEESSAASSPDSVDVPNILVLGPSNPTSSSNGSLRGTHHDRWTSNASVISGYTESVTSSQRTSSTATAGTEGQHLTRLRYLLLKAGMSTGYVRSSGHPLPTYVSKLSDEAFGNLPWQMKVLSLYKQMVVTDKTLQTAHTFPSRRLGALEIAKSVKWLVTRDAGWSWMRDLYRLVFGFGIDDADRHGGGFQV